MVQKTQEHESVLCFTNLKKIHRDIFEMMGLIKHVKVFNDEEDALRSLKRKESNGE
jgi:anti-anti-sigma regulatory factor